MSMMTQQRTWIINSEEEEKDTEEVRKNILEQEMRRISGKANILIVNE